MRAQRDRRNGDAGRRAWQGLAHPVQLGPESAPETRRADAWVRGYWHGAAGPDAPGAVVLPGARAAAPLSPVSPLQLLVRHRLGRPEDGRKAVSWGDRGIWA